MNDNIIKSSKRETNFELLRVVCMIMVVAIHFIGHGDVVDTVNVYSANGIAVKFLKALFMVADNSFVLISGYFMSKSKFKIRKFFTLWVQVLFYSVVLFLVSVALGKAEFSLKDALYSVTPIFSKQYWFFSTYILLYLLSPLINIIIDNIDQKKHFIVLTGGFILFSVMESVLLSKDPFCLSRGKSVIWFVYLYLVGAYIRIYYSEKKDKKLKYAIAVLLFSALATASFYVLKALNIPHIESDKLYFLASITSFPTSVCFFLYFKNLRIKNDKISRILVFLSPLAFGIYLIHDNNYLGSIIWKTIKPSDYANSPKLWSIYIVSVLGIYIVCSLIEYLRQLLFKLIKFDKFALFVENKIEYSIDKIKLSPPPKSSRDM